ncbi:MAG: hypothetical protein IIA67_12880, partial [Planctomycetes bacterium]|nr:hypothetical protein [Planctomycetota bacterium]
TSEHVRWCLAYACPLRDGDDRQRPDRTERQLRPLRALGEAQRDGRCIDGICVAGDMASGGAAPDDLRGFSAEEVGDAYGGLDHARELCGECPAHAADDSQLAGCFGCFDVPAPAADLHATVETVLREDGVPKTFDATFARTRPRWYALWIDEVVSLERLSLLRRIIAGLVARAETDSSSLSDLLQAVDVSVATSIPLHVTLVPAGRHEGHLWTVDAHCWRCKAPRAEASRRCHVCGQPGRATPARVRNARGRRPYQPLANFLSRERIEKLLARCSK